MPNLLNRFSQKLAYPKTGKSQDDAVVYPRYSMMSQHTCPCCSYLLLRHLRLGGLYWRCSHCYQEMPAF
ncbi:pentapeptide repeat protein [Stanieria sp. NIES-3757]|nr:pentapeptide repeat protein [Stanieria sp. NIES-3757]